MPVDEKALQTFARLGLRMFWFRQVMFVGATFVTSMYLSSLVPVYCYISCLAAELIEAALGRKILALNAVPDREATTFVRRQTLIAGWSAASVSFYGAIVAYLGEPGYLFVPISYVFAASLYATVFNHQIQSVLITRISLYVAGFLAIALVGLVKAGDDLVFAVTQAITLVSCSFFAAINAFVFHANYRESRQRDAELVRREVRLREEAEERKSAELAKLASEIRFRSLFENAPIPIREEDLSGMKRRIDALGLSDPTEFGAYLDDHPEFLQHCAGEIVVHDANRAALVQHGYSDKSEMLEKVVTSLSPAAMKVVRLTLETLHAGKPGASYETKITRKDKEIRNVAATWSVLPGFENTYERILLCSIDITDRMAAEAALRQAQKMEAVGQLTGGVAHDFNNLLTVISGNIELIEASSDVDPNLSQPILQAVQRAAELVRRLLAFSRKQPLSARATDLGALVDGMSTLLGRSLGEEIAIVNHVGVGVCIAHADPAQIEAALLNLALNARDAMPRGGTLTISSDRFDLGPDNDLDLSEGRYVGLTVSDNGSGMQPEILSRAVEPFFTTKEVGKGSGLGLSMIYGFARQSGGALRLSSEPGKGSDICLILPASEQDWQASLGRMPRKEVLRSKGETILVLEDDPGVRGYLVRMMEALGYHVLPAQDAQAARKILDDRLPFDLLISDIMLPGGTRGPEFAREMLMRQPQTPVIFISGRPSEIEIAEDDALKHAQFIAKPFSRDEIATKIRKAFGATLTAQKMEF